MALILGDIFIVSILINLYIIVAAHNDIYSDPTKIPYNRVGLLLGTAKHEMDGGINPYYTARVKAAVLLYNLGKIDRILVSGDNSAENYNEPLKFKKDLIAQGVPEKNIYLDYAGFRTLASIVRAKEVFGLDRFTIISQKHHNQRALFLARQKDIEAVAYNADEVYGFAGLPTRTREFFARVKAAMDIVFDVKPKYLGRKIKIE